MRTLHVLRLAALTDLLLALGHAAGAPWTPDAGPAARAVAEAMQSVHFDALGATRSYFDFYRGFGWMLEAYLLGHAVLFWQLGALAAREPAAARSITAVLVLESAALTALSARFLFVVPLAFSIAILALLLWALAGLGTRTAKIAPAA